MIGRPVGFAGQILTRLVRDGVRTTPFAQENRPIAGWIRRSRNASGRDAFYVRTVVVLIPQSRSIRIAQSWISGRILPGVRIVNGAADEAWTSLRSLKRDCEILLCLIRSAELNAPIHPSVAPNHFGFLRRICREALVR